jgi:small nuclear ribonucleoprotein D3
MSVTGKRGVGIPTMLLHDTEGTIVTIELKNGDSMRGLLDESEDNMNCILRNVTKTDANGNISRLDQCYIRGGQIVFVVLPDMLKNAPMFRRLTVWKKYRGNIPPLDEGGDAVGVQGPRGQAAAIIRKASQRMQSGGPGGPPGGKGFGGGYGPPGGKGFGKGFGGKGY